MEKEKHNILLEELLTQNNISMNVSVPSLAEKIIHLHEGTLSDTGAVCVTTEKYTGRSPKDRFIVDDHTHQYEIDWNHVNQKIDEKVFNNLYEKVICFLKKKDKVFVYKGFAGADSNYRLPIQVITEFAWQSLFAKQMFITPTEEELKFHQTEFTVISAPSFKANPHIDGTHSEAFILISFKQKIILIGGTKYAGEIKKAIFSIMNYLLPKQNVLPMHCSVNVGSENNVALFFGLSGTGKTTLSTDKHRDLLGDDEHGWSPDGVFNIEGGCYAKCSNLTKDSEPEIYNAIRFGAVLENVVLNKQTHQPKYNDLSLTENTRVAYPLEYIENSVSPAVAGHPDTIIFLTADATGTLPPISKLTRNQAIYHFLSGYTSKLAGTERGVTEPEATFSACYGSPFLPLPPNVYAEMLGEKIDQFQVNVFLINTGWVGGPHGIGNRIMLSYTRAMVHAAINNELNHIETTKDSIFGLTIPTEVKNVPEEILIPKNTWTDKSSYDVEAKKLAHKFHENFKTFKHITADIKQAGPLCGLE